MASNATPNTVSNTEISSSSPNPSPIISENPNTLPNPQEIRWADVFDEENAQAQFMERKFLEKPRVTDEKLINLLELSTSSLSNVRIFDEKDGLRLVHYLDSSDENTNHLRGVVVDSTPKIVCRSFPYTPEFLVSEHELSDETVSQSKVVPAFEGTVLRVFNHNDEWYISTHKKINGKNSRWGFSPTFGTLFSECWGVDEESQELNFSQLSKNRCYIFFMSHPHNGIVCQNASPTLYHIATYENNQQVDEHIERPNVKYQEQKTFETVDQLNQFVNSLSWREFSGAVVFLPNNKMCKIVNQEYFTKRQIRGNESNLRIRFFELFQKGVAEKLEEILPEKKEYFEKCREDYTKLKEHLFQHFDFRHVKRNYLVVPQQEHNFLQNLIQTETGNRLLYNLQLTYREYQIVDRQKFSSERDAKLQDIKNRRVDFENEARQLINKKLQDSTPRDLNAMIKYMNNPEKPFKTGRKFVKDY